MTAFADLLHPLPLTLMVAGTVSGIIFGAVPGMTGAMLIALSLPLTFSMSGSDAMILLVSMYVGSISGGLVTATVLKIPGTPASVMTTLDGHPMARQGRPGRALGLGISASMVGGVVSWVFLVALARPMADWSTRLGPFDLFALVLVALVLIASVSQESLTRGILAGLLGILAALPGTSPATGELRLTFGLAEMHDGFKLLPVLIGVFAVGQILHDTVTIDQPAEKIAVARGGVFLTLAEWRAQAVNLVRSSLIGTWVGILPGIGANIGSVLAYSAARAGSAAPEKFGHGSDEGIVASEAANNATVGGALIPLVALGIPGSVIDAILLGGLVIHGLTPGPLLFEQNPDVVHTIMAAVLASNLFMFAFMTASVAWLARLGDVPRALLVPAILTFCVVGSYALANRMFDVWVTLIFGLIGYGMNALRLPLAPFVIGFVLAPIAEESLGTGLMASGGSYLPLVTRPVALTFCTVAAVLLAWPLVRRWQRRDSRDHSEHHQKDTPDEPTERP